MLFHTVFYVISTRIKQEQKQFCYGFYIILVHELEAKILYGQDKIPPYSFIDIYQNLNMALSVSFCLIKTHIFEFYTCTYMEVYCIIIEKEETQPNTTV